MLIKFDMGDVLMLGVSVFECEFMVMMEVFMVEDVFELLLFVLWNVNGLFNRIRDKSDLNG